jgi:bifunctional non-homologous end joining protein LigD
LVKPELVAEIEFAGWTGDGNVRQASFKGLRADKPADEVQAETPMKTKAGRAARQKSAKAEIRGQQRGDERPLSHPEKPLWPDAGDGKPVTKLDLARYFEASATGCCRTSRAALLAGARAGRHRRRAALLPAACRRGPIQSLHPGKGSGDRKPYLQIDRSRRWRQWRRPAGWNCIPGIARLAEPDVPGTFRIRSRSPHPTWISSDVIAAAKELKERLEDLGLVTFAKTTGGKGCMW